MIWTILLKYCDNDTIQYFGQQISIFTGQRGVAELLSFYLQLHYRSDVS